MKDLVELVGRDVAGYHLHEHLGQGASAVVFRGESLASPGIVRAIKVIRPELTASTEFTKRFQAESRILDELVHDNIVRFYSAQRDAALGVLVMDLELLTGRTLADVVKASPRLAVRDVLGWMQQAARGVAAAHTRGVLHRDLKPENLFLTNKGVVKVLDFGIARAIEQAERTSKLTRDGHVAGTAAYMAPEVWRGDEPTPRSDVYALGLTMVELLLGRHPFCGADGKWPTNHQLMYRHIEGELPRIREKRPDVSAEVELVAQRALARAESARYADAGAFERALGELLGQRPSTPGAGDGPAALASDLELDIAPKNAAVKTGFAVPGLYGDVLPGAAADPRTPTDDVRRTPKSKKTGVFVGLGVLAVGGGIAVAVALSGGKPVAVSKVDPAVEGKPVAEAEVSAAGAGGVATVDVAAPTPEVAVPERVLNRWILVSPPKGKDPVLMGLKGESARETASGFRPSRRVLAPSVPFEVQQHEVTWEELDAWLLANPNHAFQRPPGAPPVPETKAELEGRSGNDFPAVGVPWQAAYAYCRGMGASLPTEEQWEYAARGEERRPYAWGSNLPDLTRTAVFQGAGAGTGPVMSRDQDATPAAAGEAIYDLMGNAQEWTADLWRESAPGGDESWVQNGVTSFRAVRGLPLAKATPTPLPTEGAAYRDALCATGPCVEKAREAYEHVGFRCVRAAAR